MSLVGLLGFLAGCPGDVTEPTGPTILEIIDGRNQSGQVGSALPAKVVVKASNNRGPVAGATITMSTESQGGGSVSPRSTASGADGTAQFTWTLGPKVGNQTLTASVSTGTAPLTASTTAIAAAGPASSISATSESFQFVVVGRAVPILPAVFVTDGFGNAIAGVPVTFEAVQGGGSGASVLTGTSRTTDAQGAATLGSWSIGPDAVSHQVRASIPSGAAVTFEARGIPAAFTVFDGTGQTANAGTAVAVAPGAKAARDDGSPLPNVPVTFLVSAGGGSVVGATATTGADGVARPSRWVLGLNPGANRLEASTAGRPAVQFDATGVLAVPAQIAASPSPPLGGVGTLFGNYLNGNPEVTVTDAQGNPVAGATVNFQVTDGGGQVTQPAGPTDYRGRAATTSWRLGPAGTQTVTATVGALPAVVFNVQASAPPASSFQLSVRYATGTTPTPAQQAAFDAAVTRWRELILAGAPPYQVVPSDIDPTGTCPSLLNETVDGAVVSVRIQTLSSPNILGATGLCVIRDQGFLPVQGLMVLNSTALATLEERGKLLPVIIHEIGHALGFATIWDIDIPGLGAIHLTDGGTCSAPTPSPTFNGLAARAAFYGSVANGTTFTGSPIPLETTGGCGTAFSHWKYSTFLTELLVGYIDLTAGAPVPSLSAMTVQSFRDLGYVVNDAAADSYSFQALVQGLAPPSFAPLFLTETQLPPGPITVINRRGGVVARIPRPLR